MNTYVVVSGLPASGKTTLAGALARALGFTHLDKDAFLEILLSQALVEKPEDRAAMSRRADIELQHRAAQTSRVVLSSWWRHPKSTAPSGTPVSWLLDGARTLVEVHCFCPATIAVQRFRARRRHPGHLDALRSPEALLAQFQDAEALGPLFPDRVIVFDTSRANSNEGLSELVRQVRQRLEAAREA